MACTKLTNNKAILKANPLIAYNFPANFYPNIRFIEVAVIIIIPPSFIYIILPVKVIIIMHKIMISL